MSNVVATICAWCDAKKPEGERDTRANISHGICPACLAEVRARITAMKAGKHGDSA